MERGTWSLWIQGLHRDLWHLSHGGDQRGIESAADGETWNGRWEPLPFPTAIFTHTCVQADPRPSPRTPLPRPRELWIPAEPGRGLGWLLPTVPPSWLDRGVSGHTDGR